MHIHIDKRRIAIEEQRQRGVAVARQEIGVCAAHGADQQFVAHRAAVHEQELHLRIGAVVSRQSSEARHTHAFSRDFHTRGIFREFLAHDARKARQTAFEQIAFGCQIERAATIEREGERNIGPRHGEALDDIGCGEVFGARGFQKFQPRGRGEEKLADFDARAGLSARQKAGGFGSAYVPAIDADFVGVALRRAAGDCEPRNRADGRQRLAAEAERFDVRKIVVGKFRCRVALDRQKLIVGAHAFAIVFDGDQIRAAIGRQNVDARRTRVERVFDQFLCGTRGPLDHFARGDAVDRFPRRGGGFSFASLFKIAPRQHLAFFDGGLIERIDAHQPAHDDRLQHEMHEESANAAFVDLRNVYPAHGPSARVQRLGGRARLGGDEIAQRLAAEIIEAAVASARWCEISGPMLLVPVETIVNNASPGPSRNNCNWLC